MRCMVSGFGFASSASIMTRARKEMPDLSARTSRVQSSKARAALICAAVIVALFVQSPLDLMAGSIAQFVQLAIAGNQEMEIIMATAPKETKSVQIPAPRFGRAEFHIKGTAPLVIHRFSKKTEEQMKQKMEAGKTASSRKNREAKSTDDLFKEAQYSGKGGWGGFHAGAIRNAMISACRLVNFKMTLAKMSIFVEADGYDVQAPQIPLIRIIGKAEKQEDMARVATGQPYVTVRAAYYEWEAKVRIRWDEDQFTLTDISNLLSRVGQQVGICEGRPDSPNSAGMGWGLFELAKTKGVTA